ncbi:MAG: efflux RND transporter periplasmic adaptor subunit [Gammaproteobacteria bacterium]|nr:efflux RND transporter periplasmic adaptor subunit [Gammaproteobacteria bacterium]
MIRSYLLTVLTAGVLLSTWPLQPVLAAGGHADDAGEHEAHGDEAATVIPAEIPKGPHGGKLFAQDGFAIELALYETGVPPEFHAYATQDGHPLAPEAVELTVELTRIDGQVDHFSFKPLKDFLRGQGVVSEPHSFDVAIEARHAGKSYRWTYASYEGRTEIPAELAQEAGIVTEIAGPAVITETLNLTGRVQSDPARIAQVRARFPGVVQNVTARLGERVQAGSVLARIQSNESLQTYALTAPIDGVILRRDIQPGMATGDEPLFVIADLSQVWVELDVFARQISQVKTGQAVRIETLDGKVFSGRIDWLASLVLHASQSIQARVILDNPEGQLRPGQFVRGQVTVAEHPVELAVRQSAIQGFRDFQVVFARFKETYEVRMLEFGKRNSEWAEVIGGLRPGTEYVTGNSYLIKADIDKSGASHDH